MPVRRCLDALGVSLLGVTGTQDKAADTKMERPGDSSEEEERGGGRL